MANNIKPGAFPKLSGTDETAKVKFVSEIYDYANGKAQEAITWYLDKKWSKQKTAQGLRFAAIIFTTIGGVIPLVIASRVLASAGVTNAVEWGQFGYVALALAGACVFLDKFFGYSSGWMRYITTAMKLQRMVEEFNVDWAILSAAVKGNAPDATERETMLRRAQTFLQSVLTEVESETAAWAAEYRSNLAELEKTARQQLEASRPGVINLKVANVGKFRNGVTVFLDEVPRQTVTSTECQLSPVFPGDHFVKVQGSINDKTVMAGAPVRIEPGQSVTVTLSLPEG